MKTIAASVFKAQCLRLMEEVRDRRVSVEITKKGIPVAKLVPVDTQDRSIFGCMRGRFEITGDIVSPVVSAETWESSR